MKGIDEVDRERRAQEIADTKHEAITYALSIIDNTYMSSERANELKRTICSTLKDMPAQEVAEKLGDLSTATRLLKRSSDKITRVFEIGGNLGPTLETNGWEDMVGPQTKSLILGILATLGEDKGLKVERINDNGSIADVIIAPYQ